MTKTGNRSNAMGVIPQGARDKTPRTMNTAPFMVELGVCTTAPVLMNLALTAHTECLVDYIPN
jgi:hypothetical protein